MSDYTYEFKPTSTKKTVKKVFHYDHQLFNKLENDPEVMTMVVNGGMIYADIGYDSEFVTEEDKQTFGVTIISD